MKSVKILRMQWAWGMLMLIGCAPPSASAPQAKTPVVQPPGSSAPVGGAPSGASAPVIQGGAAPGLEANDFAWLDSRKDLPFSVREYLAQRKPGAEQERRLALYRQGLGLISSDLGSPQSADLQKRIGEAADLNKLLAGQFSDTQISQIVADSRPAVALLDQAQAIPASSPRRTVFAYVLRADALYPEVQAARGIARLAAVECYHARRTNQLEPALKSFERALQLSRDLQPQGPMVCQLVSMAIDNFSTESVARLLLDHPSLTPADCDRLLAALKRHQEECLPRYAESLKGDYLTIMNTLAAIQSQKLDGKTAFESLGTPMPTTLDFSRIDFEADYAAVSKLMGIALQDAEIPYFQLPEKTRFATEHDQVMESVKQGVKQGNPRVPVATILMIPAAETARDSLVRTETALKGLQCLLALRRFELTHGTLPPALEVAAQEAGLKEIPQDLYGGGPL